jgi:hypothetical protein
MTKQIKTFTAGSVLTASDVNSYLMNQTVIAAQSTDRPTSPQAGMTIWETDTRKLLVYTTATTGWVPPWNMPWGVQYATTVSSSTSMATNVETDITGLTAITWTAVANRRYRTTITVPIYQQLTASSTTTALKITDTSNVVKGQANWSGLPVGDFNFAAVAYETGLAAGSITRKARMLTTGGTGSVAGASVPLIAIVEDLGPFAAPA